MDGTFEDNGVDAFLQKKTGVVQFHVFAWRVSGHTKSAL